jgi:hypothetical protein
MAGAPVVLEWFELSEAAHVGALRHIETIRRGIVRADGTVPDWGEDVEGACAERAVAKWLGVYWSGSVNGFHEPDVGRLGVRHAKVRSHCLIVRDRDLERYGADARFVFVTGERGEYELRGWATLSTAMRPEWMRDPHGWGRAWFVPTHALVPMEELWLPKAVDPAEAGPTRVEALQPNPKGQPID